MALAAFMTASGVSTAYRDLIRSRMAMVAQDIADDINNALALGLRLPEQMTLPAVLARQAAADPRDTVDRCRRRRHGAVQQQPGARRATGQSYGRPPSVSMRSRR